MYLAPVFERDLISAACQPPAQGWPDWVHLPPGDDMALLGWPTLQSSEHAEDCRALVAADPLIVGVHVDHATLLQRPDLVAGKALRRNLSDVAAMGAVPWACVCCAMIGPKDGALAEPLLQGLRQEAERYACPLVGGDTASTPGATTLVVTVLATPGPTPPLTRSGAKPGDTIYVTGSLGGSLVQPDAKSTPHHLGFVPRLQEALQIAPHANAMMDLSDGLAMDAPRLAEASSAQLMIDVERVPGAQAAQLAAMHSSQPLWHHTLGDGEDYELLFTSSNPELTEQLPNLGCPLTAIGCVKTSSAGEQPGARFHDAQGQTLSHDGLGYEHQQHD